MAKVNVCRNLLVEEKRLAGEVARAHRWAELTNGGHMAMQEYVDDILRHWAAMVQTQSHIVDDNTAIVPWNLKLVFMQLYVNHLAVLCGYPHCPPLDELNAAVARMGTPVAWGELERILDTTVLIVQDILLGMPDIVRSADDILCIMRAAHADVRRHICRFRATRPAVASIDV